MGNNGSKPDNRGYHDHDRDPRVGRGKTPNAKPRTNQKAPRPKGADPNTQGDPPADEVNNDQFEEDWSDPEDETPQVTSYFSDDVPEEENNRESDAAKAKKDDSSKKASKKKDEDKEFISTVNLPLTKEMNDKGELSFECLNLETLEEPESDLEEENKKDDDEGGSNTQKPKEKEEEEEEVVAKNPKGEIVFQVDNFSYMRKTQKSQVLVTGDLAWRISVFPPYHHRGSLSIYVDVVELRPRRKNTNVRTCFTLSLLNEKDPQQNCFHKCEHTFNNVGDWGFNNFCSADKVLDPKNGFLISGALVVTGTLEQLPPAEGSDIDWSTYDSKEATGYVGLRNQGATCYMNSLLQTLYHTSAFTQAVFEMPTGVEFDESTISSSSSIDWDELEGILNAEENIPQALQSLFFNLRFATQAPSTRALTKSFGWDREDSFTQHDVQELDRVLLDNLESKMVGTPLEGTIKRIFGGCLRHSIQCTDVDFESAREEVFYDLSLDVRGFKTIEESLAAYTAVEKLDGDNKYMAEGFGLQCAEKTTKFLKLPPVLHVQLKRWDFDLNTLEQRKVNDKFEFSDKLDFTPYLDKTAPKDEIYMYRLHAVLIHSGSINGGHYYVYIRPTQAAKWFKFNDEVVTPTNIAHVFETGFGGEGETTTDESGNTQTFHEKFSNACKGLYGYLCAYLCTFL